MAIKVQTPSRERGLLSGGLVALTVALGTGRVPAVRAAGDPGLLVDRSRAATAKRTPSRGKMRAASSAQAGDVLSMREAIVLNAAATVLYFKQCAFNCGFASRMMIKNQIFKFRE